MNLRAAVLASVLISLNVSAQSNSILDGRTLKPMTLGATLSHVTQGSVVIIGENHGFLTHQQQQVQILQALRNRGLKVSVGMEFFTYTDQLQVDAYRAGTLSEGDFLAYIGWGSPSFDFYRAQATFPNLVEGSRTIALNAPRTLTSKVAKLGLAELTPEEQHLLPPQFQLGRDSYRTRFIEQMPHLPSPEAKDRYFAAQSIWDDTMAWQASEFLSKNPEQVLVIVVGEFHVKYGGGLPDRLRARSARTPLLTFSLVNISGLLPAEVLTEVNPSPTDGPRADVLWLAPL